MEHVADYIRSNYSADGLEVTRVGKKQLVITCPPGSTPTTHFYPPHLAPLLPLPCSHHCLRPELADLTNLCKTLEIEV